MSEPLTDKERAELRALLDDKRREIEEELRGATEDAQPVSLETPIGRLSRMDAIQQQHMAGARKARLEGQLDQLKAAQRRFEAGEYGDCLRCEEPIGSLRLKVKPEASLCRACQEASGR